MKNVTEEVPCNCWLLRSDVSVLKSGQGTPPAEVCSRYGCQVVFHFRWGESFEAGLIADPHLNVLLRHLTLKALLKYTQQSVSKTGDCINAADRK